MESKKLEYVVDLHTHTVASGHAYNTIQEMVESAKRNNIKLFGITEHAVTMPGTCHDFYFHNLKMARRDYEGIELCLGVELNIIDYEGNVDMLHEDEHSMYIKKFWEMSDNERKKMIGQYMYDIEIPYDYYSGIKESEFVVCKEESREIKIHIGYECWGEGEEKNVQPLYTTVEQLFLMVHEKKLLNYDDFETKYIVVTK